MINQQFWWPQGAVHFTIPTWEPSTGKPNWLERAGTNLRKPWCNVKRCNEHWQVMMVNHGSLWLTNKDNMSNIGKRNWFGVHRWQWKTMDNIQRPMMIYNFKPSTVSQIEGKDSMPFHFARNSGEIVWSGGVQPWSSTYRPGAPHKGSEAANSRARACLAFTREADGNTTSWIFYQAQGLRHRVLHQTQQSPDLFEGGGITSIVCWGLGSYSTPSWVWWRTLCLRPCAW